MSQRLHRILAAALVALGLSCPVLAQEEQQAIELFIEGQGVRSDAGIQSRFLAQALKISEHWIGLACSPEGVSPALRSHLELPADRGLLVTGVVEDSPAAKAGFKEHDILLTAGDKALKDIGSLMEAVDAAKETEMTVELVRQGKKISIKVTPAKRPENQMREASFDWHARLPGQIPEGMVPWLHRLNPQGAMVVVPRPGVVMPSMPKDLSISVNKEGDKPAKITVRQGDKTYEATSEDLSAIPDELRPHVQLFLGNPGGFGLAIHPQVDPHQLIPQHGADAGPNVLRRYRVHASEGDLLQDILKRLESLQKAVDELQKGQGAK